MHIAYHIGAHCTDDERLLKSLLRNRDRLAQAGVAVPGPSHYRAVLRDVVNAHRGAPATAEAQDVLLETILDGDDPQRLVLSNPSFVAVPGKALDGGALYPKMWKAAWLRNLFPDHEVSFHIALRDPATFVPALYALQGETDRSLDNFMGGADPMALVWSAPLRMLAETCPDCRITVWAYEDCPLIWDEILRAVAGVTPAFHLHGGMDMVRTLLTHEGVRAMRAYLHDHPPATPALRREVYMAFLDKFAAEGAMEDAIDLPGWTEDLMDDLSAAYDADLAQLGDLPNVTILAP